MKLNVSIETLQAIVSYKRASLDFKAVMEPSYNRKEVNVENIQDRLNNSMLKLADSISRDFDNHMNKSKYLEKQNDTSK